MLIQEPQAAQCHGETWACESPLSGRVKEIRAELLLIRVVRRCAMKLGQPSDGADVRLHGAIRKAAEPQVLESSAGEGQSCDPLRTTEKRIGRQIALPIEHRLSFNPAPSSRRGRIKVQR